MLAFIAHTERLEPLSIPSTTSFCKRKFDTFNFKPPSNHVSNKATSCTLVNTFKKLRVQLESTSSSSKPIESSKPIIQEIKQQISLSVPTLKRLRTDYIADDSSSNDILIKYPQNMNDVHEICGGENKDVFKPEEVLRMIQNVHCKYNDLVNQLLEEQYNRFCDYTQKLEKDTSYIS